jgi:hypothetical protein
MTDDLCAMIRMHRAGRDRAGQLYKQYRRRTEEVMRRRPDPARADPQRWQVWVEEVAGELFVRSDLHIYARQPYQSRTPFDTWLEEDCTDSQICGHTFYFRFNLLGEVWARAHHKRSRQDPSASWLDRLYRDLGPVLQRQGAEAAPRRWVAREGGLRPVCPAGQLVAAVSAGPQGRSLDEVVGDLLRRSERPLTRTAIKTMVAEIHKRSPLRDLQPHCEFAHEQDSDLLQEPEAPITPEVRMTAMAALRAAWSELDSTERRLLYCHLHGQDLREEELFRDRSPLQLCQSRKRIARKLIRPVLMALDLPAAGPDGAPGDQLDLLAEFLLRAIPELERPHER